MTSTRLITPSQLALFSRSPVIGAWWEELEARGLFQDVRPEPTALEQQLFDDGLRHEQVLLNRLEGEGHSVARLSGLQSDEAHVTTQEAMAAELDFVHQASLCNGEMRGSADLLRRIPASSDLGAWSYVPIECKLSSKPRTTFLVQALAYVDLLTPLLGRRPERFELYLGGGRFQSYPVDRFWAWYQHLLQRYQAFRATFDPTGEPEDAPGDHGRWSAFIDERLEQARDLTLVANLRTNQRSRLQAAGIRSIDALAALPEDVTVPGLAADTLNALRLQAQLQVSPRDEQGRPPWRLRDFVAGKGLLALPPADPGDVWFDMEGIQDAVAATKLEYLFGTCFRQQSGGEPQFRPLWAHSPAEEKRAFEEWVDWIEQRRSRHPALHVYHYGSYEKTALRRLAQQHCTREAVIDNWLRSGVLVDLLPVVSHAIVLGEPSYSIKKVERLYMDRRTAEVAAADESVVAYLHWRASGEPAQPGALPQGSPQLQSIEDYNRDDCLSTVLLHDWLLDLRERHADDLPAGPEAGAEAESAEREPWPLETLASALLAEMPEALQSDPPADAGEAELAAQEAIGPRGLSWRVQRLLAQLLPFHHREMKVAWWAYFDRRDRALEAPDELEDDSEVIAGAIWQSVEPRASARTGADFHTFRFDPSQPLKLHADSSGRGPKLEIPVSGVQLEAVVIDDERGLVTLKDPWRQRDQRLAEGLPDAIPKAPTPLILVPTDYSRTLRDRLLEQATAWVEEHAPLPEAMQQLLARQPVEGLVELNARIERDPDAVAPALAAFLDSDKVCTIALQGPPGTGKTTITGRLIAELARRSRRIAVCATSHAAINNLLLKTHAAMQEAGLDQRVVKANSSEEEALAGTAIEVVHADALSEAMAVIGGTAWTFSRPELEASFDLLVVDEAGQMALGQLLVMARCARSILLVGDQQQLAQPSQADHPGDSRLSCLDYLMQDAAVVPAELGVFLATSWRMEPSLAATVSALFYDGRLHAAPANGNNAITWASPCPGSDGVPLPDRGLVFEAVEHAGCSVCCDPEIDRIEQLVAALLGSAYRHASSQGPRSGRLEPEHILVTAPYNVQVNRLQQRLDGRARVGTVDRFQGQEAPVAIHSLTASDADAAPRGLSFLLEPNRLNVAISRARCLSIVVGSPGLASGIAGTVAEAEQINRLCRLMD